MDSRSTEINNEQDLISGILSSESSSDIVSTTLRTDQKVIARVTDGIYRQPASALRELISNSYDADATRVVIKTDAPRFERISVEDDGHGMTPETLAHLLFHIGGSAKRSDVGKKLGVTSTTDNLTSPGGRRLIGKIGIGLFSVSQLTYSFQIITKIKDDQHRTVATVALKQFTEDHSDLPRDAKGEFESGKVNIWREKASDTKSHGTTIVLTNIRPQARDTLRSRDVWSAIEQNELLGEGEEKRAIEPPKFHIGRVDKTGELLRKTAGKFSTVPWDKADAPEKSFLALIDAVWDELLQSNPNPQLERLFDYYLRMVWQLGLAVPLPYIDGHIFDVSLDGFADAFFLSNQAKGAAKQLEPKKDQTARELLGLLDKDAPGGIFDVYFDELKLSRPIKFRGLPASSHALKRPLIFFGKCTEHFDKIPRELSGGPLEFEAYLFWTPKVAPTEHQGSLIRIHGSSGTLFDATFMRYQVSEQTRLRQVTCEIFVHEGLDSALNIDRESFNNAHPHAVFITKWLHSALRQLATAQKRLAGSVRENRRDESTQQTASKIQKVANDVWADEIDDPASPPPPVEFTETGTKSAASADSYVYQRSEVVVTEERTKTAKGKARETILEEKLKAITQILATFGLLEKITMKKQEKLLKAIYKILDTPED